MSKQRTVKLTVKDATEGDHIVRAMEDPATRAFVIMMGILQPFNERARQRILMHVSEMFQEEARGPVGKVDGDPRLPIESIGLGD